MSQGEEQFLFCSSSSSLHVQLIPWMLRCFIDVLWRSFYKILIVLPMFSIFSVPWDCSFILFLATSADATIPRA